MKNGGRKQRGEGVAKASEKGVEMGDDISVGTRAGAEGKGGKGEGDAGQVVKEGGIALKSG